MALQLVILKKWKRFDVSLKTALFWNSLPWGSSKQN